MSAPKKHHKETLNFTGFPGYYGPMSGQDGYGGFNYTGLVEYLNASYWQHVATYWCNTGYQNVAAATGASAVAYIYNYGTFTSEATGSETFNLKSFVAAAAWSANQEWTLTTYNGTTKVGSMNFYVTDAPGSTASTIHVTGAVGSKITSFSLVRDTLGSKGNTCTYHTGVYGYQMVMGALKISWNGKIPASFGQHTSGAHHHVTPHAALAAHTASHEAAHQAQSHHTDSGYHNELLSLHHDSGSLASQFHLPAVEHIA